MWMDVLQVYTACDECRRPLRFRGVKIYVHVICNLCSISIRKQRTKRTTPRLGGGERGGDERTGEKHWKGKRCKGKTEGKGTACTARGWDGPGGWMG